MNIHEAAEIVRNCVKTTGGNFGKLNAAKVVLIETMLAWLDPTPITEEWLRANGWGLQGRLWRLKECELFRLSDDSGVSDGRWRIVTENGTHVIKTLGELRTPREPVVSTPHKEMGGGE